MSHDSPTSRRTTTLRIVLVITVVAFGTAAVIALRPAKKTTKAAAASIFKTVKVTSGDLSTSERIDGTVVFSDVTTVLHRIAGQTSSATSTSSSSTPRAATSTGSSATTTATTVAPSGLAASGLVASGAPVPDVTVHTVPSGCGPSTTAPTTTGPDTTLPGGPTTTAACATTTTVHTPTTTRTGTGTVRASTSGGTGSTGGSNARVTQVVTSVLAVGAAVTPGTVLYSVESSPVVALTGTIPVWRTMSTGITDGVDVLQLETSLKALGYDPGNTMTVDGHFDARTKAVVEAWQAGYGLPVTGKVTLGEVVFIAGPTTVSAVNVKVGDSVGDGDKILSLAGSSQQVVIAVPAADQAAVVPGLVVQIGTVNATVTLLRSVVRSGAVVVEAVLTPSAAITGAGNGSTVKVTVNITDQKGVLIVPAAALVSRLDGTYAVQVVQPDGTNKFVTVEILAIAGFNVGIRGDGVTADSSVLQPL